MQLSVASVLARRGLDPGNEASRLAGLPRAKAAEALAAIIASMPFARWKTADTSRIACRLSQLLPSSARSVPAPGPQPSSQGAMRTHALLWLLFAGFVVASLFNLMAERHSPDETHGAITALHSMVSP